MIAGPDVRVQMVTSVPHDEPEGYPPSGRGLFVTSDPKNNVVFGEVKTVTPKESRPRTVPHAGHAQIPIRVRFCQVVKAAFWDVRAL